jgi:hypothetical protein
MLTNGQALRLWTAIRSANEGEDAMSPDEWVKSCIPPAVGGHPNFVHARQNILAAFRFAVGPAPGFNAEDYVNALASAGAVLESIVTLGQTTPDWIPWYGAPYWHVPDVTVPTNRIAEQVREFWGWR